MAISASRATLESQIYQALMYQKAAQIALTAQNIAKAVALSSSTGFLPTTPKPTPLVPSGLSAGMNMIQQALSLGSGAQISLVSSLIARGVSLIAPRAPSTGLSALASQINSALSLQQGARQQIVANLLASAIITYYVNGGII